MAIEILTTSICTRLKLHHPSDVSTPSDPTFFAVSRGRHPGPQTDRETRGRPRGQDRHRAARAPRDSNGRVVNILTAGMDWNSLEDRGSRDKGLQRSRQNRGKGRAREWQCHRLTIVRRQHGTSVSRPLKEMVSVPGVPRASAGL
jgi:hypothetical protein